MLTDTLKLIEVVSASSAETFQYLELVNLPPNGVSALLDFIYTGHTDIR